MLLNNLLAFSYHEAIVSLVDLLACYVVEIAVAVLSSDVDRFNRCVHLLECLTREVVEFEVVEDNPVA